MKKRIDLLLENQSLKNEFLIRNLNVTLIYEESDDLRKDNHMLKLIMKFADAYRACPDTEELMKGDFFAPPVPDPTTPWDDWTVFERWLKGEKLVNYMKDLVALRVPDSIPEKELSDALEKLICQIENAGTAVELCDLPALFAYKLLHEWILEENPIAYGGGGWVMNGCGAYCPGCLQRPWCDVGVEFCWSEDDEIRSIHYRPELKDHVSAVPDYYSVMRARQEEWAEWEIKWKNKRSPLKGLPPLEMS